ncbi:MAG: glycosyltransferase family 2 protein [Flavobacterium sp.]
MITVSVIMITYGHEDFIEQAINGILMQECDFEVELIIANDCSPDKTDEVIRKIIKNHPKSSWIKYTNHQSNLGMIPNFIWAIQQARGNYIAICEGDDYWTDSLKLQKQVDFLEANEEYVICGHWRRKVDERGISLEQNEEAHKITALSTQCVLFKNIKFDNLFLSFFKQPNCGETFLYYYLEQYGKSIILPFLGADYRISSVGVWSMIGKVNQFESSIQGRTVIQKYFKEINDNYLFKKVTVNKGHIYLDFGLYLMREGKYWASLKKLWLFNKELIKISPFLTLKMINIKLNGSFLLNLVKSVSFKSQI